MKDISITEEVCDELFELTGYAISDSLEDGQAARLVELVEESEEVCDLYCRYINIHITLAQSYGIKHSKAIKVSSIEEGFVEQNTSPHLGFLSHSMKKVGNFISKPTPLSISVAFIILVSFLATLALISISFNQTTDNSSQLVKSDSQIVTVATVSELQNCNWDEDSIVPKRGDQLQEGDLLSLKKGLVRIEFKSGASVNLRGPVRFKVNSPMSMTMLFGLSTFHVPQAAKGFTVETAAAKIVDLGTRFGVSVNENESTSIHVFKGKVAVTSLNNNSKPQNTIELTKGQAARFTVNSNQSSRFVANEREFSKLRMLGQSSNFDAWKSHVSKLIQDDDLVGYWSFDNENVNDLSRNLNHGKAQGYIQYSSLIPAAVGGGKSLNLGDPDNSVRITHSKSISDIKAMTIAFWMKSPIARISKTEAARVFNKQAEQRSGWKLRNEIGTNSFRFNLYSNDHSEKIEVVNTLDGKWHHFAVTVDQSFCQIYIDGKLSKKTPLPKGMQFNNTEDLVIGAATRLSNDHYCEFNGYLDEILIFRRVLSAENIRSLIIP